ncbi:EAL domain-containing protein [Plasticicumulans acidivorans]|uniref:cyclic-guanylate-specific phosphodiesterase n=1 Tax=Plasticicumulans acidivorans TaxID=886464 RepID=A0A317MYZ4_9GAMM|nr:EAL domain-containing protein [Plasticicumulans acidivorans]PWV64890.1 PAS domain S-box-containing protein/diguanylate cyclase (GGDEF)-like protein [Plasticicumulans acidivorans]
MQTLAVVEELLLLVERTCAPCGALLCDTRLSGDPVIWSTPGFTRLTGYNAAQIAGRGLHTLLADPADADALETMRRAIRSGQASSRTLNLKRQHGTPLRGELSTLPLRDRNGGITRYACLLRAPELATSIAKAPPLDYHSLFANAVEGVFRATPDGRYLDVNQALARICGYASPAALLALPESLHADPERRAQFWATLEREGTVHGFEAPLRRADGSIVWISESARAVRDETGALVCIEGSVIDITERKAAEEALASSERRFRQLVEQAMDAFIVIDLDWTVVDVNEQACRSLGYSREELVGASFERFETSLLKSDLADLAERLDHGSLTIDGVHQRKDGSRFPVETQLSRFESGDGVRLLALCRDISDRRRYEAQLRHHATHDPLTGLPNRHLLEDRLQQSIAHARRRGRLVGVLCLDLNRFSSLVDSFGHAATDQVLRETAERLGRALRPGDTVARHGSDSFMIVLDDLVGEERASQIAGRLGQVLTTPFTVAGQEVFIDASIGISLFPRDGNEVDALLRHATSAMQRARQHPGAPPQFFAAEMNLWTRERLDLETRLRRALEAGQLELYYQPQIDLKSGQIAGVEALLRWHHPQLGTISPAEFIPLAEETGLILPIGDWVLRTACEQARAWRLAGLPPLRIAVNLSALQFAQAGLVQRVEEILADTELSPGELELEITESVLMRDIEGAAQTLRTLHARGVSIALDDFGTGYSSLAYLKRFQIDRLKIDRSFVRDICADPDDAALTQAIVAMARNLHLSVIAEGVETSTQQRFLCEHGCDEAQGYLFSHPLPAAEVTELIAAGHPLARTQETLAAEPFTLLLVDDDASFIAFFCACLHGESWRILCADSGRQGLDLLAHNRVDVVVADQVMPTMSGNEFMARVHALYPKPYRVMLSGGSTLQTLIDSINVGSIQKFLTKPITPQELRKALHDIVDHLNG